MPVIEDELHTPWVVVKGDPGWLSVSLLRTKGFEWIVLPQEVLSGIGRGEKEKEAWKIEGVEEKARMVRMNLCLYALGRE